MTSLLRFEDVSLVRGGRLLFEGLSFVLGPGEALRVAGPNGSGKSSLLRLAAGLLRAQHGRVERTPPALADDHVALDRELRLDQALRFWTERDPRPALADLGLDQLAAVPVRYLSAGQAKRASLARVAGSGRALWLLDEPLNGLDAAGIATLAELLARHRDAGGAILAASHSALAGEWSELELAR